jgi:hypothetical protein
MDGAGQGRQTSYMRLWLGDGQAAMLWKETGVGRIWRRDPAEGDV